MKHQIREVKLKSGAKGLLVNVPNTNVVNFVAGFNSGNLFCDPVKYPELSHVMEHVMMGANQRFPSKIEFRAEIEKNGAYSNAWTMDYFNVYEFECADFEAESIVELLAAEISTPLFLPAEVRTEISNVKEELNGYLTDYARVSYDQLLKAMLARPTYEDSLSTVDGITSVVARNYWRRTHTAGNMRFIFSGAVDKYPDLVKRFEKGLSQQPAGQRLAIPAIVPEHLDKPVYIKKDIPQVYYQIYQFCPELSIEDEPVMALLSILLAGRYKSRILGEARERGLAYHVYSSSGNEVGYAYLNLNFFATPANIAELFKLITRQLREVKAGNINETEVAEAKQLMLGRRLRRYKTPNDLISWYYGYYFTYDHIEDFNKGTRDVTKISVQDVVRVATHLLQQPKWGLCLVGNLPAAKVKELHAILADIWE